MVKPLIREKEDYKILEHRPKNNIRLIVVN